MLTRYASAGAQVEALLAHLQSTAGPSVPQGSPQEQSQLDLTSAAVFLLNAEWLRQQHAATQTGVITATAPVPEPAALETAVRQLSWGISLLARAWNASLPGSSHPATAAEIAALLSSCAPDLASHFQLWLQAHRLALAGFGCHINIATAGLQLEAMQMQFPDVITPHVGKVCSR